MLRRFYVKIIRNYTRSSLAPSYPEMSLRISFLHCFHAFKTPEEVTHETVVEIISISKPITLEILVFVLQLIIGYFRRFIFGICRP